jgi:hypothetical protein
MGVRFVGLSTHERARIANFLDRAPFRVVSENLTNTTH